MPSSVGNASFDIRTRPPTSTWLDTAIVYGDPSARCASVHQIVTGSEVIPYPICQLQTVGIPSAAPRRSRDHERLEP
jgi:hypothetical protein